MLYERVKLPGLTLGVAIVGLILAPLPVTAAESITPTSDQQIENALKAATAARTAYTNFYAAANDACLPFASNVESCVFGFFDRQSAGDGGPETAGLARTPGSRVAEQE